MNIYIERILRGRLGMRILSYRPESISHLFASLTRERYFQHSKIKFVSLRGHVIFSIFVYLTRSYNHQQPQRSCQLREVNKIVSSLKVILSFNFLVDLPCYVPVGKTTQK